MAPHCCCPAVPYTTLRRTPIRLYSLVAAALLTAGLAVARADTVNATLFVGPNTVTASDSSGFYGANTNLFAQFDPAVGILNSVTLSLTGSATSTSQSFDLFGLVTAASNPQVGLSFTTRGSGSGGSTFAFSGGGQDTPAFDLPLFEGTGTQALRLDFLSPTTVNNATGTLTYNNNAAVVPPVA